MLPKNPNTIFYIIAFLLPLFLSLGLTPLVRLFAVKKGLLALPRPDRWHKQPTALLGGVGIYLSVAISCLAFGIPQKGFPGLFLGGTFLFFVGLLDDRLHFPPHAKLFAQIIAGAIAISSGVVLNLPLSPFLTVPLTLFWIIAITNSFNLLDNIDGLAAGICAISSLMLFLSSLIFSSNHLAIFALIIFGAALGFLPYNFNPARIFMGDSGSMFLGYSLAIISVSGAARHLSNLLITLLIPVLILSVPIFDTIFVMIRRKLQGRNIFEGGKDHTSHSLVTLGLSQKKTVLVLYAISLSFGLIGILFTAINIFVISIIAFLAVVILLFFGLFLFEFSKGDRTQNDKPGKAATNLNQEKTLLNSILFYKRRIFEVLLDLALICVAYFSAFLLRFEGTPMFESNLHLIEDSLLWIILIKMLVFFTLGLYRGVWRYVGISDFFTIFKVTGIGSVAYILFLTFTFRFLDYSRAVLVIDWLILLFLITGSRFLFRIIGEFFSRAQNEGTKVIIFGAGDTGEMVIREMKRNKTLRYNPIGFVDDDPYKIGNKIHGVPVLGSRQRLRDLVRDYQVKEVIVAIASLEMDAFLDIAVACKDCGITYRKVRGILDKEEVVDFEKTKNN